MPTCVGCQKEKYRVCRGVCEPCRRRGVQPLPAKTFNQHTTAPLATSATTSPSAPSASPPTSQEQVITDRQRIRLQDKVTSLKSRYAESLKTIERLEREQEAGEQLQAITPYVIEPRHGTGTGEATVIVEASDWHLEERVEPATVSGLNDFNLEIADERVKTFFQATLRLTRMFQQDVKIETLVMGLLGDFISGDIHEEIEEVCQLPPMEAIVFAQDRLVGGIEFLLNHSALDLHLKCHSGNHGRTTKTTRFATENGHSLEYLMYRHLAAYFRSETRVTFDIAEGPHSYTTIYGKTIRFQHGHMVKYQGGVGGITIPVNKAIAQWNMGRQADLDCFGHFHQQLDGNHFLANGSLVGYNSFALSIKAPFDVPKQTMFLMDKKRGRTGTWPILFNR